MSTITLALHVLNTLIGILSLTILALASHSIILKDSVGDRIPQNVTTVGMGLLMWAAVGGFVDTILFLVLLTMGAKRHSRKSMAASFGAKGLQYTTLFVATFILCRPLIILIYTVVENDQEETLESWACRLGSDGGADALCQELRAARYLLIPVLVLCATLCAGTWWTWVGVKKEKCAHPERIETEIKEGGEVP